MMSEWSLAWKQAAKKHRREHKKLLEAYQELKDDYYGLYAEMASLSHAEKLESWLKGFRQKVARKKWRTQRVWRAWYALKYREGRLARLEELQAPDIIIQNEKKLTADRGRWFREEILLERIGARRVERDGA